MNANIISLLTKYICSHCVVEGELDFEQSLIGGGIISSIALIQLIAWIEETFELSIPPDDFVPEHFDSVRAIADYIATQKGAAAVDADVKTT